MTIRPATEQDLPLMLQLSKESLGEIEGMRTEEYWRWKHVHNPFGNSPVLLAFEGEKLIGLRAFMNWRFRYQGKSIQAYRAVDTATHPDHRGQGIFSKLSLALIEQLKEREPAVIFNTPNSKSMPGYLKMGWKTVGKTRLMVKLLPYNIILNRFSTPAPKENIPPRFPEDMAWILNHRMEAQRDLVLTDYSLQYLQWRYQDIPVVKYHVHVVRDKGSVCVIVYRMKSSPKVNELRLTEVFYDGPQCQPVIRRAIHELADLNKPDVITVLADPAGKFASLLPFGFIRADKYGLTITCRKINDEGLETLAMNQQVWGFSAGTLELF